MADTNPSYVTVAWVLDEGATREEADVDAAVGRVLADYPHVFVLSRVALVEIKNVVRLSQFLGILRYVADKEFVGQVSYVVSPLITTPGVWVGYAVTDWAEVNRISGVPEEVLKEAEAVAAAEAAEAAGNAVAAKENV